MLKKMLFVTVMALIIGLCQTTFGAEPNKPAMRKDRPQMRGGAPRMDEMGAKLGLNEEQKKQIAPLRQQQRQLVEKIVKDPNLNSQQKQKAMQEARQATDQKINAILTPEQQKQFAAMKPQGPGEGPLGRDDLQLTPQQKEAMRPIMEKQRTAAAAIRDDASLSQEQKTEKIQALRKATQEEMSKILTPEQSEKMNKLRESHGGADMKARVNQRRAHRPADSNAK